uniref:hypothetical protein n=1 Tax=Pedobacter sp. TaxID=1411316 RepID=UPI0015EF476D|nr:hypothetical protein [Pedobacter sp.]
MAQKIKAETSLQEKLQQLSNGVPEIELTKAEAALYCVDVADMLPDADLKESEG